MNRLFEDYSPVRRAAAGYPAMNVWTHADGVVVTAEVPGVRPDDIDVSVVGETLTLSGVRNPDEVQEGARYHRQERGYGQFTRTLQLPFPVNVDDIDATFRNGVLNIQMPRAEDDKPRKISVKTA
jgi:HSP20 family protein